VRPNPQMEIPPSDDESNNEFVTPKDTPGIRLSPELNHEDEGTHLSNGTRPGRLIGTIEKKDRPPKLGTEQAKKRITKTRRGRNQLGTQVSSNFVSYKLRKKGQGGSNFRSRRFRKR